MERFQSQILHQISFLSAWGFHESTWTLIDITMLLIKKMKQITSVMASCEEAKQLEKFRNMDSVSFMKQARMGVLVSSDEEEGAGCLLCRDSPSTCSAPRIRFGLLVLQQGIFFPPHHTSCFSHVVLLGFHFLVLFLSSSPGVPLVLKSVPFCLW